MRPRDRVFKWVKLLPWVYHERRQPERSAARKAHIMDDASAPGFCEHCGAAWDDAHEQGRCGVADATARILSGYTPRKPQQ